MLIQLCFSIFAVHARDVGNADLFRTRGLAFIFIGTIAKSFLVHLRDHVDDPSIFFRLALRQKIQMRHFRRDEQHRRRIGARGHARAAADALRRVHRELGGVFGDRHGIGFGR